VQKAGDPRNGPAAAVVLRAAFVEAGDTSAKALLLPTFGQALAVLQGWLVRDYQWARLGANGDRMTGDGEPDNESEGFHAALVADDYGRTKEKSMANVTVSKQRRDLDHGLDTGCRRALAHGRPQRVGDNHLVHARWPGLPHQGHE
jgi:hypothetical protein